MKKINKVIFLDNETECDVKSTGNVIEIGLSTLDPISKEIKILPNITLRHKTMTISPYCENLLGKNINYYKNNGVDPVTALNLLNKIGICSKETLVVSWGNDISDFNINFRDQFSKFYNIPNMSVKFSEIKNFLDLSTLFRIKWASNLNTSKQNISLSEALRVSGLMFEDALKPRSEGRPHEPRDDAYNLGQLFRCMF